LSITQDTPNPEGQWKLLNYKGETKLPPRIGVAHSLVENLVFLHGGQNFNENKHFDDFYTLNLGFSFKFMLNSLKNLFFCRIFRIE